MMSVLDYHQRVENRILLDHCSPIIGIREGLRIEGDYILKTEDLRAGRTFDDCIQSAHFISMDTNRMMTRLLTYCQGI